jgi:hypothetical protein
MGGLISPNVIVDHFTLEVQPEFSRGRAKVFLTIEET